MKYRSKESVKTIICLIVLSILIVCPMNIKAYDINNDVNYNLKDNYNNEMKLVAFQGTNNVNTDENKEKIKEGIQAEQAETESDDVQTINDIADVETFGGLVKFFSENSYKHAKDIGIAVIIFLVFTFLRKVFAKYLIKLMLKITSKTKTDMDEKIVLGFQKPFRGLFIVLGIYFPLKYLGADFHISLGFIDKCLSSMIIILVSWGLYNLTSEYSVLYEEMKEKFGLKIDKLLFPFVSKCLRVVIVAFAITIVLAEWDINIQMFVTGLGIGGLAISLAAKDAASNIIAGIVIILEKPFSIGDWISTSEIEGTVEDISFRSTIIRNFGNELVTVPNSNLTTVPITNYSKRGKRRITFNLGLTYSTSREKIEICASRIKKMLINHPDIHNETIFVTFDKFNDSSLDLFLYFFTKTTVWGDYLKIKEDINLKIMNILEEEGVSIAFPSTSVYFENPIKYESEGKI